jgi:hypothetical protein
MVWGWLVAYSSMRESRVCVWVGGQVSIGGCWLWVKKL